MARMHAAAAAVLLVLCLGAASARELQQLRNDPIRPVVTPIPVTLNPEDLKVIIPANPKLNLKLNAGIPLGLSLTPSFSLSGALPTTLAETLGVSGTYKIPAPKINRGSTAVTGPSTATVISGGGGPAPAVTATGGPAIGNSALLREIIAAFDQLG